MIGEGRFETNLEERRFVLKAIFLSALLDQNLISPQVK